jgi:hypothetical protein
MLQDLLGIALIVVGLVSAFARVRSLGHNRQTHE